MGDVKFDAELTVLEFKLRIKQAHDLDEESFEGLRLLVNGKVLEDDAATLKSLGVTKGADIEVELGGEDEDEDEEAEAEAAAAADGLDLPSESPKGLSLYPVEGPAAARKTRAQGLLWRVRHYTQRAIEQVEKTAADAGPGVRVPEAYVQKLVERLHFFLQGGAVAHWRPFCAAFRPFWGFATNAKFGYPTSARLVAALREADAALAALAAAGATELEEPAQPTPEEVAEKEKEGEDRRRRSPRSERASHRSRSRSSRRRQVELSRREPVREPERPVRREAGRRDSRARPAEVTLRARPDAASQDGEEGSLLHPKRDAAGALAAGRGAKRRSGGKKKKRAGPGRGRGSG